MFYLSLFINNIWTRSTREIDCGLIPSMMTASSGLLSSSKFSELDIDPTAVAITCTTSTSTSIANDDILHARLFMLRVASIAKNNDARNTGLGTHVRIPAGILSDS